jgi:hypothetical protein
VKVTVSKNSHKNETDLKTYVNVNGTTYGHDDIITGGNVIEFGLSAGIHTFKKYSGTGNIHVASIEIVPVESNGIENIVVTPAFDANAPIYDVVGRQVSAPLKKGIYIQNGHKFIVK